MVVTDFEKDLKDGTLLCLLVMRLTGKEAKYNKTPGGRVHKKRENFQIAFQLLKDNGYDKEAQGVSAEDFEKDEQGDVEKIDSTQVLGFFWQLMLKYKQLHFNKLQDVPTTKGMSKYQLFLNQLETFIALQGTNSCWSFESDMIPIKIGLILKYFSI